MSRALGRYELLRPLARGGMAEVYLARRRAAGVEKWLVVKRMRSEHAGDARFLDLFVREARLTMSLAHQNIVPVFDFGRIDDQVFLAMERVEGKDLGSSLARAPDHRLQPLLAAFVAAECCQALDYAHQRKSPDGVALGIVHRDVTPRNVLLSWSGEVKLTDFGIAALAGDAARGLLGTPQYMAPEQARSEPLDARADIYAIGLVLREALTGVRPRPGGTDRERILDAARKGELAPWNTRRDDLADGSGDHGEPPPAALVAIIDKATALDPAARYADARSLLEDLDAFIVAERAAHKVESPPRQLAAWLATVWGEQRDEQSKSDAEIDAEHLVSFLDDGALDVIGTGTERSLAATAAEDLAPAEAPPGKSAGGRTRSSAGGDAEVDDKPAIAAITSASSSVASGSFEAIPSAPPRRQTADGIVVPRETQRAVTDRGGSARAPLLGLLVGGLLAGAIVFFVMNRARRTESPPPPPPPERVVTPPPPPPPQPDHEVVVVEVDAGTAKPPEVTHQVHHDVVVHVPRDAGTAVAPVLPDAAAPAAKAGLQKVTINATPWAYFYIDGSSTQHETVETIELAPGPHKIHFANPTLHIERDVTIEVPADRGMGYVEHLQE